MSQMLAHHERLRSVLARSRCCVLGRIPRLTTPERASYERFRKRQQDRTRPPGADSIGSLDTSEPGKTLVGQDPVEGEPMDLRMFDEAYRADWQPPTDEQLAEAALDFEKAVKADAPDGFGDLLDEMLGGEEAE